MAQRPPAGAGLDAGTGRDARPSRRRARPGRRRANPWRRRAGTGRTRVQGQAAILAAIAIGGGLGSTARYLVSEAIPVRPGHFPWATFMTNMSGCFLLGLLMVFVLDVWPPTRYVRPFFGIGVLGGYTTFSTFAVEIRRIAAYGAWVLADAYILNGLVGGLAAVWCGMTLARLLARLPVRAHPREGAHTREGRDT